METWKQITDRFDVGQLLKGDKYRIVGTCEKRIILERIKTGSKVTITRRKIETTGQRLDRGEFIPRRKIDYTVAIETIVVIALGSFVEDCTVDGVRGYRKAC